MVYFRISSDVNLKQLNGLLKSQKEEFQVVGQYGATDWAEEDREGVGFFVGETHTKRSNVEMKNFTGSWIAICVNVADKNDLDSDLKAFLDADDSIVYADSIFGLK